MQFRDGAGALGDQIEDLEPDRVGEGLADPRSPFVEFLFQFALAIAVLHGASLRSTASRSSARRTQRYSVARILLPRLAEPCPQRWSGDNEIHGWKLSRAPIPGARLQGARSVLALRKIPRTEW